MRFFIFIICLLFSFSSNALAPEEHLSDPIQEQRAMNLFLEVRCIVCQGQVIENSSTEFSYNMRKFIREKIAKGFSDDEIKNELVDKFGADILTSAAPNKYNILLWILPMVFAVFLLAFVLRKYRG